MNEKYHFTLQIHPLYYETSTSFKNKTYCRQTGLDNKHSGEKHHIKEEKRCDFTMKSTGPINITIHGHQHPRQSLPPAINQKLHIALSTNQSPLSSIMITQAVRCMFPAYSRIFKDVLQASALKYLSARVH